MGRKKSFFWQLYPYFLLVSALSVASVAWHTYTSMNKFYLKQVASDLESRAKLVETALSEGNYPPDMEIIDTFCDKAGKASSTRITVILPSGKVVGDSERDPRTMDNHGDRPEIIAAKTKGYGISQRFSFTLGKNMMYVAIPLKNGRKTSAIVRASLPVASIGSALRKINAAIIMGSLVVLVITALVSFLISRQISKPIIEIKKGADSFSRGQLDGRVSVQGPKEIESLGNTLNEMAKSLKERIHEITEQRNELKAILSNMMEGVIALDMEENIIALNQAASEMLGCEEEEVCGLCIQEVIRDTTLQGLVSEIRSGKVPIEEEIGLLISGQERKLWVHGTVISGEESSGTGMLIVLVDVTKLNKLENIRQEFVANVSHELKTPITAIKGFVETLQEGAIKDPERSGHFLKIIKHHADRLEAIVEDLLCLSRLEQDKERKKIPLEEHSLHDFLGSAIAACKGFAELKSIKIHLRCAADLRARINPMLLEQAIINLLDNAIKYSDQGKEIVVQSQRVGNEIEIKVKDGGWGIGEEHLPRLFERFYRVDKARSRNQGGTGLGLAIVKHVANVHGGNVSVTSTPGKGSIFSIRLPGN